MPDQIAVRDARVDENTYIMETTRLMVCEMERYGAAKRRQTSQRGAPMLF
jgi:hypothetical protein